MLFCSFGINVKLEVTRQLKTKEQERKKTGPSLKCWRMRARMELVMKRKERDESCSEEERSSPSFLF